MSSNVQSVERAFAVLGALAARGRASVGELAAATGLPKPTVSRLLSTMRSADVVTRAGAAGVYVLGDGLMALTATNAAPLGLGFVAKPYLVALGQELGEDVGLAYRSGAAVHFGDTVFADATVRVAGWEGEWAPLHAVAAGFVWLAASSDAGIAEYCGRGLERLGPNTLTTVGEIMQRVDQVRAEGVCWTHEEWAEGIDGAAVPVLDGSGQLVAALNMYGPSYRFPSGRARAELAERLQTTAAEIRGRWRTAE